MTAIQCTELPVFRGIDVHDSFVLGWSHTNDALIFDLEASVWPQHPAHEKPKRNEFTCYKNATLTFQAPTEVHGLRQLDAVTPTTDPDGSKDYDSIERFELDDDGTIHIAGDFGDVTIKGATIQFTINHNAI